MSKKLLMILSVLLISITTYAYSALSTSLAITSEVRFRPLADIRVNSIRINNANDATMQYESDYSKNTISSGFVLPTSSSSISYLVHIDNTGDVDYSIYDIIKSSNNNGLNVSISGYNLKDIIEAKSSLDLIITYTTSEPSDNVINVINTFEFREVYHISYVTGTTLNIAEQIKYEDEDITLTDIVPTKEGYLFNSWNTKSDGTGVNYLSSGTYTLNEDKIFYAKYNEVEYDITYVLNGGSNDSTNPSKYKITTNNIVLKDASKSGYTFLGWTGNGTNTPTKNLVLAKGSTGNKEYTANFKDETKPTVEIKSQDGSVDYLTTTYTANANWDSTNANLTFYIDADDVGSGVDKIEYVVSDSSTVPSSGWVETSNGTLTVSKALGTYYLHVRVYDEEENETVVSTKLITVRYRVAYYDDYSKSNTVSGNGYYTGTNLTLRTPTDVVGYTFDGWYSDSGLNNKVGNKGASYTPTTSIKLYGKWVPTNYTISYTLNGGTVETLNPTTYNIESANITLNNPTKTGYTFNGWSGTDLSGSTNKNVTISSGSTGNRSYTANFSANKYTVTINSNDGVIPVTSGWNNSQDNKSATKEVTYDSVYGDLPTPTRTGYTFKGWYTATSGGSEIKNTTTVSITGNQTIYARWADETKPSNVSIVSTNNVVATQTATLSCTDGVGVTGYYFGTTAPTASSTYENITSTTSMSVTKTINAAGTYYLACKDAAGNISTSTNKVFYKTTLSMDNGSVSPTSVITMSGNSFNLPTPVASTGYTVKGLWYTDSAMTSNAKAYGVSYTPSASSTLYSTAIINKYTVEVKVNHGTGATSKEVEYNKTQTFTIGANAGYGSPGVSCTNSQTATISGTTLTTGNITNDTVCTVTYNANTYTISYTMNGGDNPATKPSSGTYDANVVISNPTKTVTVTGNVNGTGANVGSATSSTQEFAGWSSSTIGTNAQTGSTSSNYAAWNGTTKTKNTYFKNLKESGTVTMVANWTAKSITLPTLSKTGYVCKWYTESTGGSEAGKGGDSWTPSANSNSAVTLYARCSEATDTRYKVNHYVHDLGSDTYTLSSTDDLTGTTNATLTLANLKKTITGATYVDGYLTGNTTKPASGAVTTTTILADGSRVINLYYRRNYLYVQYDMNGGSLSTSGSGYSTNGTLVTYNSDTKFLRGIYGGKVGAVTTSTHTVGTNGLHDYNNSSAINIVRTGYVAKSASEWNTLANGTGTSYNHAASTYDANGFAGADLSTGDKTVTVYVNWVPVDYTITYATNNGTVATANPTSYNIESNAITLNNPTKTLTFKGNYNATTGANAASGSGVTIGANTTKAQTFAGWSGSNGNTNQTTVTIAKGSTGNKSYTAHWTSVAPDKLPKVERTGYTCGWNTSSSGTTIQYASEATNYPTSAITEGQGVTVNLYAVCTPNTYTVKYAMNGATAKADETVSYDNNITITKPTKTFTVNVNANSQGATIKNSAGTAVTSASSAQTFAGWSADSNLSLTTAKYGTSSTAVSTEWNNASTKIGASAATLYLKNLRTTSGNVTLTANWTAVAVTLPNITKTGYTCGYATSASGAKSYNSGASYTPSTTTGSATLYAKCVDDIKPTCTLTSTATLKKSNQTATLKCSDGVDVTSYYFGTKSSPTDSDFVTTAADLTSLKGTSGLSKTITAAGTYYLFAKDAAGNISDAKNVVIYSYTVNNMLQNTTGSTYTTTDYTQASTATYLAPANTSLTLTSIYTIPTGSKAGSFKGVSVGAASTNAVTPVTTAQTLNGNNTYSMWFIRNIIYFKYKKNNGVLQSTTHNAGNTATYTWAEDANGYITRNGSNNFTSYRYGTTTIDLYDYNNINALFTYRTGYVAKSGAEYICESGCTTANKEFSHSSITFANSNEICDASSSDCTVVVNVNWQLRNYTIGYTLNGGTVATANPTSYNVTTNTITLNNPTKTGYTFSGWTEQITGLVWNSGFVNLDTGIAETSSTYATSYYTDMVRLKSGVSYTLSGYGTYAADDIRWRIYGLDGTYKSNVSGATYTPSEDCYVRILYYNNPAAASRTGTIITSNATTSASIVKGSTHNRTYVANYTINNPATPTITGGATKVYGASATTLTCASSTTYASGTSKYYSFGYATSDGGTPGNWTTASTTATLSVSATAYVGQRWYSCRVYASDGTLTSTTVASATTADTEMTLNNAKLTFNATTNGGTLSGTGTLYTKSGATGVYTGVRNTTAGTVPTASKAGYTFNGWYTAASGGSKVLNANGTFTGTAVANYTSTTAWVTTADRTLYAQYSINNPATPTITGGATKIYGASATTLTCASSTTYASGTTKYYSFGYATSDGGTPGNWTTASTTATLSVSATAYVGQRWYSCRVYASDGTLTSTTVASATTADTEMTLNNAKLTFNATTNGGTLSGTGTLYTKSGATGVYTGVRNTTAGTVPTASKAGYTFNGWYTAASGGSKVLNANGTFTGTAVANYTSTTAWVTTADRTLYAQYSINNPATPTITGGATKIYNESDTTLTCASSTTYASGTSKYYEFGYATSAANFTAGTITWLGSPSTTATTTITKTAFRTTRYYTCRVYASDGTSTSGTVQTTATTTMALVNARLYFDATTNGGTLSGSANLYVPYGQTNIYTGRTNTTAGTIPTATKTGYTFNGWYTAASGGTKVIAADGTVQASVSSWTNASKQWLRTATGNNDTSNVLYAQYSINSYTVKYDTTTNGGTGTIADKSVNYDANIDLTPTGSKSGWTFVGWNTDKTATTALSTLKMGTNNVTLYAIYRKEAITLTAKWNANGATLSSTADKTCTLAAVYNTATQSTSCTVDAPTITRSGYTVIGFNTTSGATTNNTSYNTSTKKLTLTSSNTGTTWYAITRNNTALTATFAANNGATVSATSATCTLYNGATSCTVDAPTVTAQSGFTHIGFNTSTSSTTNNTNYNTSTKKLTISANGTWYPITRSSSQYTGTFNIQDSAAATQSGGTLSCYRYNGGTSCNITAPTLTAKSGYTVVGWNKTAASTTATYASAGSISINANTTFYSITYNSTPITITFNRNTTNSKATSQTPSGGSASTAASVSSSCTKYNGATSCNITSPSMAVSTGYHVVGYNTTATATTSSWNVSTAKTVSANATYYAITAVNTYSIKFNVNCPSGSTASGTMSNLSMTYGTAKNLTANAFKCSGYIFDKWTTAANGTGTSYTDSQSVNNLTTTNGGTVNLYAQWKEVWAENLSYNNSKTGVACSDVQCMIDKLWSMLK